MGERYRPATQNVPRKHWSGDRAISSTEDRHGFARCHDPMAVEMGGAGPWDETRYSASLLAMPRTRLNIYKRRLLVTHSQYFELYFATAIKKKQQQVSAHLAQLEDTVWPET